LIFTRCGAATAQQIASVPRSATLLGSLVVVGLAIYGGLLHASGVAPIGEIVAAIRRPP